MSALRTAPARWLAAATVLIGPAARAAEPPDPVLRGATWRDLVLAELVPAWRAHVVDGRHGGFHTSLGRDWRPRAPYEKLPAMIGRQVFSFTAAYLLSGDERHIEVARRGVDYLLARAWDERYGGWYDRLSVDGAVLDDTKTAANELYANVGLALSHFLDREFGGGFATLNRDGSLADDGSKAAPWHTSYHDVEHGLVNVLLLSLYVNREPATLHFRFEAGPAARRYVSLVDDPRVRVGAVTVDGEPWADFHAEERSVWLPASSRARHVAVTLNPPLADPAASDARKE